MSAYPKNQTQDTMIDPTIAAEEAAKPAADDGLTPGQRERIKAQENPNPITQAKLDRIKQLLREELGEHGACTFTLMVSQYRAPGEVRNATLGDATEAALALDHTHVIGALNLSMAKATLRLIGDQGGAPMFAAMFGELLTK